MLAGYKLMRAQYRQAGHRMHRVWKGRNQMMKFLSGWVKLCILGIGQSLRALCGRRHGQEHFLVLGPCILLQACGYIRVLTEPLQHRTCSYKKETK